MHTSIIQLFPEIDAVFGITDEIAIGAMKAVLKSGRQIPDNFGVVGFSNWQISSVVSPSLTTVAQPGEELGKTSVRLLLNGIKKEDQQPDNSELKYITKIIKTSLIIRESSCKATVRAI